MKTSFTQTVVRLTVGTILSLLIIGLGASRGTSCACGCGVFEVGDPEMFPTDTGGTAYLEYDYMDQNRNWSGTSRASAANNDDKDIRADFWTAGVQYMFNRKWGVMAEVPYVDRHFETTDDDTGDIVNFYHSSIGDIRLRGIYTGFSPDMSTGVTFGVKLPTGDHTYAGFDPDTSIGSGSTDLLLGAFHSGALTANGQWAWFVNGQINLPFLHDSIYRPGSETDGVGGIQHSGWKVGKTTVAPLLQLIGSYRMRDGGSQADPPNSGYERLLLAPGFDVRDGIYRLYADVGFPVYQNVNGNQVTASALYTITISRDF